MKYCPKCEKAYSGSYKRCPWHTGDISKEFAELKKEPTKVVARGRLGAEYIKVIPMEGGYCKVTNIYGSEYTVASSSVIHI